MLVSLDRFSGRRESTLAYSATKSLKKVVRSRTEKPSNCTKMAKERDHTKQHTPLQIRRWSCFGSGCSERTLQRVSTAQCDGWPAFWD